MVTKSEREEQENKETKMWWQRVKGKKKENKETKGGDKEWKGRKGK